MIPYANLDGDSSIVGYDLGTDFIWVYFETKKYAVKYRYNYTKPGQVHVSAMQKLAVSGSGLNGYIDEHVKYNYAEKVKLR